MRKRYRLVILDEARVDIKNAFDYIAYALEAGATALKWHDDLLGAIEALSEYPQAYSPISIEPWKSGGYRRLKFKRHYIIYKVVESQGIVIVAKIVYARRDLSRLTPPEY